MNLRFPCLLRPPVTPVLTSFQHTKIFLAVIPRVPVPMSNVLTVTLLDLPLLQEFCSGRVPCCSVLLLLGRRVVVLVFFLVVAWHLWTPCAGTTTLMKLYTNEFTKPTL